MKKPTLYIVLLLLIISIISCRQNRLKTDEKTLAKEIYLKEKTNEKKESDRMALKNQESDSIAKLPNGLRYKEDRSVDQTHPPVIIDIAGSLNSIKDFKLSDFATSISYIRIAPPPDSGFRKEIRFRYLLTDESIIALNAFGMVHYTSDGRYVNTIVKNEFTNMKVTPEYVMSSVESTFIGNLTYFPKSIGKKLRYTYVNDIIGQEYLMEYDCSEKQLSIPIKFDPENPGKILGQGQIMADLNHGKPIWRTNKKMQTRYEIQSSGMNWLNDNTYMKTQKEENMIAIFNKNGDTLSTFKQYERLVNYTKSLQRGADNGTEYEFNGEIYFRNPFNDTVSLVRPPNRLLPVYVIKLENYKVLRQQGIDPGFDLTGKIIPEKWAETDEYIFLTFTKDNYDCVANRKNKKVKIYYAVFSKKERTLSIAKGDPFDYSSEILRNDIDGGIPVWPSSYMVSKNGELLISLKGKDLKERVKSEHFKNSPAPELKKNTLKQLAAAITDSEDILMIIK